jgi:hypothetical protein
MTATAAVAGLIAGYTVQVSAPQCCEPLAQMLIGQAKVDELQAQIRVAEERLGAAERGALESSRRNRESDRQYRTMLQEVSRWIVARPSAQNTLSDTEFAARIEQITQRRAAVFESIKAGQGHGQTLLDAQIDLDRLRAEVVGRKGSDSTDSIARQRASIEQSRKIQLAQFELFSAKADAAIASRVYESARNEAIVHWRRINPGKPDPEPEWRPASAGPQFAELRPLMERIESLEPGLRALLEEERASRKRSAALPGGLDPGATEKPRANPAALAALMLAATGLAALLLPASSVGAVGRIAFYGSVASATLAVASIGMLAAIGTPRLLFVSLGFALALAGAGAAATWWRLRSLAPRALTAPRTMSASPNTPPVAPAAPAGSMPTKPTSTATPVAGVAALAAMAASAAGHSSQQAAPPDQMGMSEAGKEGVTSDQQLDPAPAPAIESDPGSAADSPSDSSRA